MNKLKSKIMRRVAAVILSGAMILPRMTVYSAEASSSQDAQMISEANVDEGTAETVNDEYSKSKDEKDSAGEETTEESNETLSTVEETIIEDETITEGASEDETTTEEASEDETTTEEVSEDETTTEGASENETTTEGASEDETTNNEVIEDPNNENNITILIQPRNSYAAQSLDVTDENELNLVYEDGIWYCYENGKWNSNYYGIVDYGGSKFLVAYGVVANISGLCECNGKWYYMSQGQVQTQYTGLAYYDGEWFYVENGVLDTSKGGIVEYDSGLFLISAGRVRYDYSGLFQDTDGTWYFLSNGQVQTQYTGLVQYDGAWFLISDGALNTEYNGIYDYDNSSFLIGGGMVQSGYTGNYEISNTRYKIVEGQVKNIVPFTHAISEIRAFAQNNPFSTSAGVTYTTVPSLSNNIAGVLSDESLQNGLNTLNFMRYIAGIPYDVKLNDEYSSYAQAAAFVLAKNDTGLSHYPSNNSNIPDDLYSLGYEGARSSNLGIGYSNISSSIINGYMNDADSSNIDSVGHRRWILSPVLGYVGFGYCKNYTATYVFDSSRQDYQVDYIAWPAENTPIDVFSGPWSFHVPDNSTYSYDFSEAVVVMTNLNTGESWRFDESTNNDPAVKPYYNKEYSNYGYVSALIFDPGRSFRANDQIRIEVYGLKYAHDYTEAPPLSYVVNFFSLNG